MSEVQDEFKEASLDPSTFTSGGRTKEFDGKTVVFSGVHAINSLPGREPAEGQKDERVEWALIRGQMTLVGAEGDAAKPEAFEYRVGKIETVRASEDGNKLLTKGGRPLFKELEGAKLLDHAVKAGFDGVAKSGLSALNGQAFEVAAISEGKFTYKKGPKAGQEGEFFRLYPTKYVGPVAGSAGAAEAAEGLDTRIDGVIIEALTEAKDNKVSVGTLVKIIGAKLPNEAGAATKRIFKPEFTGREGTGYKIDKMVAQLGA